MKISLKYYIKTNDKIMYNDNLACFNTNRDVHKTGIFEWNISNNSSYICLFFDKTATSNIMRIDSTCPLMSNACIISHLKHGKGIKYDYSHFSKTEDCVYEMIIPRTEYTIYSRLYPDSAITYEEWIDCLYSAKIDHITLKEMRSSNNNKFQCPSTETFVNGFDLENNLSIDVPYFVAEKTPLTLECTMASMGGQLGVSGIWFFNKGTNNNQYDFVPSNLTNIASWRLPLNLPFLWGASSSQCNPISFFDIGIVNDIFLKDEIEYENYDQVISPNDCVINFCIKFLERFIFVVLDLDNDCSSPYYLFLFAPDYKEFMFETIINLIHSGVAIHIDPQIL